MQSILGLTQIVYYVYIFSEQGDQKPLKMGGPGDSLSITASRIFQPRFNNFLDFLKFSPTIPAPQDNRKQPRKKKNQPHSDKVDYGYLLPFR